MFPVHGGVHHATSMDSGRGEKRKRDDHDDEATQENPPKRICAVDRWTEDDGRQFSHRAHGANVTASVNQIASNRPGPVKHGQDLQSDRQRVFRNGLWVPQIQTQHFDLAANGCSETSMGYHYLQTEHSKAVMLNDVFLCTDRERPLTTPSQDMDECSAPPAIVNPSEEEDQEENEELMEEETDYFIQMASKRFNQTWAALNLDLTLNDDERKELIDKATEEYENNVHGLYKDDLNEEDDETDDE